MSLTFQQALENLYGQERRRDKLGLGGTRALLAALGNPERRFRSIHVAGTNGKGSVCAMVERMLRESGACTGLYTSPHLVDFRERIRVNGRWADAGWLERRLDHITRLPEGRHRTFFEVTTALAFDYFAEMGVEWAVIEVGLGGRLDCTNVITPEVCLISPIGLDHTEVLGHDLASVAREKAGIIKQGVLAITSRQQEEARRVLQWTAIERAAPLCEADALWEQEPLDLDAIPERLHGHHQWDNLRLAWAGVRSLRGRGVPTAPERAQAALGRVRWPGRLERSPGEPRLWWDGAHNPDAMDALLSSWTGSELRPPPGAMVLALSRDKDARAMCAIVARYAPRTLLVATATRHPRAMPPAELAHCARDSGLRSRAVPGVESAIAHALAAVPGGDVVLTGSLFAVGEAMAVWGGGPEAVL